MGHLLWSGIVPAARVDAVVAQLMGEPLWSGWGVRTMSAADEAYRPLAYHSGTVWPHDNSLIAHGLALRGEAEASLQILRSMLEAARFFDGGLPEVFAGLARRDTPFPVAYPTASRPQAWAAGRAGAAAARPARARARPAHGQARHRRCRAGSRLDGLELNGVRALGRNWRIAVVDGRSARRVPEVRIAVLSPVRFPAR